MLKYILRRIVLLIPVMLGVSLIVFSLLYFTPGDPVRNKLGTNASPEEVKKLREKMGLNDPFIVQYGRYLGGIVLHGSLGESYITDQPVVAEIGSRVGATVKLALASTVVAILIGIPLGIVSAIKQYSVFDHVTMVFALIGLSMPVFWLGLLMILLFSVKLGWLPSSGFSSFKYMILPALALGSQSIAVLTRMTRSSMLETVRQDYIRTARAKGQREKKVIFKHALGNSLIPVITVVGIQFGQLMGGAVMTEIIFSIPGIGRYMIKSIQLRDAPSVLGCVLFVAVTFAIVNLIVDILYTYVDPRIKTQYT